jgi:hypothetical protein
LKVCRQQKKINKKARVAKQKRGTTPLLLPRNPREAKKLAEVNAIIDKMIFLPDETNESTPKRKR